MAASESASRPNKGAPIPFRRSDPWILLAVAMAGFRGRCGLRQLIAAADYINHVVPTRAEIEDAANRLARAGLLSFSPEGFSLTPKARCLLIGLESKSQLLLKQLKMLEEELPNVKRQPRGPTRWRLEPARYRQALAEYLRSFNDRR